MDAVSLDDVVRQVYIANLKVAAQLSQSTFSAEIDRLQRRIGDSYRVLESRARMMGVRQCSLLCVNGRPAKVR
jgi:hypothetical protein